MRTTTIRPALPGRRRPTRTLAAGAVALVAATALAACGSSTAGRPVSAATSTAAPAAAAGFPVTITSGGSTVTIKQRPTSIVSLSATATEMLYAVGAGSQVKAVDQYSDYPSNAPITKLSGLQPNIEALLAEKPDLVVIDADRGGLGNRLAALHVPLLVMPAAARIGDVYTELEELGKATGHDAEANSEAAKVRTQIDTIVKNTPKRSTPLTYYYELEPDYYSVTSTTFVGRLLQLIGMTSIADKAADAVSTGGYPQLSAEYIIRANPDYILLADTICCKASAASVAKRPGWSTISAVREGHVVALNDDIASRWGPRIVDLLQAVANAVNGKK